MKPQANTERAFVIFDNNAASHIKQALTEWTIMITGRYLHCQISD